MAADFWLSSHHKRWIVDRATARRAREHDRQILLSLGQDAVHLDYFAIYFANVITKLGKKLSLRQRVIATATVFFRRFYLKNAYCETDPFLVIAACCYVAAKAEESPVHIKTVLSEARNLFSQDMYNIKHFPSDNSKLAEMEFYLVDDLECDLTIFHPYRSLFALCKKENEEPAAAVEDNEPGAYNATSSILSGNALGLGVGVDDGPRYWGTGEGKLELSAGALQTAWFIINDTYRSDICLLYPPHLIAVAAIYLTFILHTPTRSIITPLLDAPSPSLPPPPTTAASLSTTTATKSIRRSTRHNSSSSTSAPTAIAQQQQDPITFLSELNISLPLIATISQEIISLYTLWERYKEDAQPEAKSSSITNTANTPAESKDDDPSAELSLVTTADPTATTDNTPIRKAGPPVMKMKEVVPRELSDLLYNMRVARLELENSFSASSSASSRGGTGAIYIGHQQQQQQVYQHQQQQHQQHHLQVPHHHQLQQRQSQAQYPHLAYTSSGGSTTTTMKMTATSARGAAVNKMLERTQNAG